jgi:hypothetical protein
VLRLTPIADTIEIEANERTANPNCSGCRTRTCAQGTDAKETANMPKVSKLTKRSRATGIIAGVRKHFGGASYDLGGRTYTPKQLVAEFQSQIDAIDEVDATRSTLAAAIAKERALARRIAALGRYLKMAVDATFGPSPEVFADFGWDVPKRPGPKTVQAKLEGARKARETRKARGTMGKRQRKKVRGW